MKLNQAINIFFEFGERSYANRTLELYIEHIRRFCDFVNNKDIEDIRVTDDIIGYCRHLERRGIAANTINLSMIALRQMWKILCGLERELGLTMPFLWHAIPVKKGIMPRSHKPITADEFNALLGAINGKPGFLLARDASMFRLLYDTGMRVSELTSLNISSLDLKEQSCKVITRKRRDQSRFRQVFWTRETQKALLTYLDIRSHYTGSDALFINLREGKRLSTRSVERVLKQYCRQAGLDPTLIKVHGFRHGWGMRAADAEMYLPHIKENLGHTSLEGSRPYLNVKNHALRREYHEKLGDRMGMLRDEALKNEILARNMRTVLRYLFYPHPAICAAVLGVYNSVRLKH